MIVKSGCWFAASINEKEIIFFGRLHRISGFDYRDWKIGKRKKLSEKFPQHKKIIEKYTKPH